MNHLHTTSGHLVEVAQDTWINPTAVAAIKARTEIARYDNAGQPVRRTFTDIILTCGDYVVVEQPVDDVITLLADGTKGVVQ